MALHLSRIPTKADWIVPFVVAALTAMGSVYVSSQTTKADIERRVTTLETRQQDQTQKVDHIEAQVDKLVEWALGQK